MTMEAYLEDEELEDVLLDAGYNVFRTQGDLAIAVLFGVNAAPIAPLDGDAQFNIRDNNHPLLLIKTRSLDNSGRFVSPKTSKKCIANITEI